jgi:putative ABC transport system substrate-binding protein
MPVVGFLSSRSSVQSVDLVAAFRQSLSETGYIEGRNVAIDLATCGEGSPPVATITDT